MISFSYQAGAHVAFTVEDLASAAGCSVDQAQTPVRHLMGPLAEAFGSEVAALSAETILPRQIACLLHTALDRLRAAYKPTAESNEEGRQQYKVITAGQKKRRAAATAPYA